MNSYTAPFMLGVLNNQDKIKEGAYYSGGINQIDLLIDVELLINEAKLTQKQLEVLNLYFIQQYTQEETSVKMGITQQAVLDHIKKIKVKFQRVVDKWGELDEKFTDR